MSGLWTVFSKEVKDNLRDRRTVLSSLGMALLSPVLFMWLMSFVLEQAISDLEESVDLAVVGADNAPNLMAFLESNNVSPGEGPEDPEQAVKDRDHDVVLIIPDEYGERFESGTPATLRLVYDSSRAKDSEKDYRRVRGLIRGYSQQVGNLRLQVRGINPAITRPIQVDSTNVASPSARAVSLLGVIPYFVIFSVFMGGFYLAIDTTAGEREQGSLEPLLAQPVARATLALGKLLATAVFSAATLVLVLVAFSYAIEFVPLEQIGMSVEFGLDKVGTLFLGVLPLVLLAASFMMIIASFTKSFKEAQTYLTFVILVPTMPLLIVAFLAPQPQMSTMAIPSFSQALIINEIIKGESIAPELIGVSVISTLVIGLICSLVAIRLYQREGMLG